MDTKKQAVQIVRNPQVHAKHRREVFWQITIPLLLGILLLLAALAGVILSAMQASGEVSQWADVSLVWLILPSLLIALIILIILVAIIYGLVILYQKIPHVASLIQFYFQLVQGKISQLTDLSARPFIQLRSFWAALDRIGKVLRHPMDES